MAVIVIAEATSHKAVVLAVSTRGTGPDTCIEVFVGQCLVGLLLSTASTRSLRMCKVSLTVDNDYGGFRGYAGAVQVRALGWTPLVMRLCGKWFWSA